MNFNMDQVQSALRTIMKVVGALAAVGVLDPGLGQAGTTIVNDLGGALLAGGTIWSFFSHSKKVA